MNNSGSVIKLHQKLTSSLLCTQQEIKGKFQYESGIFNLISVVFLTRFRFNKRNIHSVFYATSQLLTRLPR
jgi:hypothetical protein